MKRWKGAALLLLCTIVLLRLLQGLAQPEKENAHVPVLGIVTTAAEDDRREAQSEALVHAAEEHGFKVLEMPVERTQEAQIEAVRAQIVYQVDAIAFTPLVESGWDNVLREAKSASVPLLSIDRAIRGVDDVPLQHIGFDYASLAEQAADALLQQRMPRDGVLELYGTVNASDAREIARGCRASLEEHGLTVTYSLCGDGMRSRGCEIQEEMEEHLDEIGYIFAQNDAMALGAVDYLHSHGRKPGKDMLICAFGGGAELRALQKKGEVAVIGALDDTQLAELTADAAQQIAKAPWKPYIALADTAVATLEGTKACAAEVLGRMTRLCYRHQNVRYSAEISRAKEFIRENYADSAISLHRGAEEVGFSPNHFSTVFSQETGQTFVEYLTAVRIEAAKQLLTCGNSRMSDIAFDVGYQDSHYFSYLFKKHVGVSPREYRSRSEER